MPEVAATAILTSGQDPASLVCIGSNKHVAQTMLYSVVITCKRKQYVYTSRL